MNNELTLWNDLPVQTEFNWQAEIHETRVLLNELSTTLKQAEDLAIKIGHKLRRFQEELPHGEFLPLIDSEFGLSRKTAYRFISLAEAEVEEPDKFVIMTNFPLYLQYELAPASMSVVKKVEAGEIPSTVKDIQAARRAEKAEKKAQDLQKELDLFKGKTEQERENEKREQQRKLDAKEKEIGLLQWEKSLQESEYEAKLNQNATKISEAEAQLLLIKAEKEQIEQAKIQIIKEDTPETKAKLEELELSIKAKNEKEKKSEEWKKHLLENNEKLAKELQEQRYANEARRKQEQYEFKIKDDCKKNTDSIYQSLKLFAAQEPIPRNTRLYSEDEWSRYDQVEQALKHCLEVVARITSARYNNQFIDANTSSDLVIYEDQKANTIDSTPIDQYDEQADMPPIPIPDPVKPIVGIPDEYLELFKAYQQAVWSNPQPSLLWSAPDNNYTDQMKEKGKHIQFTKELLRSGVDRRIRGAQEAMKRTLGIWKGTRV